MVATYVSKPNVTLNIVPRDQRVGLEDQRALVVGQIDPGRRAAGNISFSGQPSADDTITIGTTVVTFKASGATGNQVNIAGDLAATLAALKTFLSNSADAQLIKCTYQVSGTKLFIRFKTPGTTGNSFGLAKSGSNITVSAANLAGGEAGEGSASAGTLVSDVPRTDAEINELVGDGSHLAMVGRAFRAINGYTNLDFLPLADATGAVAATAKVAISGNATRDGTLYLSVVSAEKHTYQIDVLAGDGPEEIIDNINSRLGGDRYLPFVYWDDEQSAVYFEAVNGGTGPNNWLLALAGTVAGISVTLTGWTGGATNPTLTGVFDPVDNIRYQTVIWPEVYGLTPLKDFLNARKNVDNDIKDGRAFVYSNKSLASVKSDAQSCNSSEVVIIWNEPTSEANRWIGPHLPEAPDVIAAKFAAARARRFETDISVSDIVATNESLDQFGGPAMNSLPYFNTPLIGVQPPYRGSGASFAEQEEAEEGGVTVVGVNRSLNGIVMGNVVTTWLNDVAGNPDDTWRYLEWRDTHGAIREYQVLNLRKRFAQYRLTTGDTIPNRAMATEQMIKGYILELCDTLAGPDYTLIQKGQQHRQFIQDNLVVTLDLAARKAQITELVPIVSQLGNIIGTIKFTFGI